MTKSRRTVDSIRASRDGHEFHEAWVARKCLGLLFPRDELVGVAVEGFSRSDPEVSAEGNEIADAVLYYGERASFKGSTKVVVVQVKYSKASELKPFRASDAKKTVEKFAKTYRAFKRKYGVVQAREKLRFELITNRPIFNELNEALQGLVSNANLHGVSATQATQITAACKLSGKDLREFASRLQFTALTGDLQIAKHHLAVAFADWSPARDSMAKLRLSAIKEMARDKAGLAHEHRNVIALPDLLTALEIGDETELLPCPASFPNVGSIIQRHQLRATLAMVPKLDRPLLVHADGGVGKTVFINSIAAGLERAHEVVLFDCFGMGQYRAPGDARHLPRRGLVHIANDLACRGLCDPLLPTTSNSDDLIRVFRARLNQAADTVRRVRSDRQIVILLDAIDNANEHARDQQEPCFPKLLLESIGLTGRIEGVQVVASARSHRRAAATGGVACEELALLPFTLEETGAYLRARISNLTDIALQVAQSRSRGNARVLEHLANEVPDLLATSEINKVLQLDDLLRKRIAAALSEARTHGGYREQDIQTFFAGLATLPPPVPIAEFAQANRLPEGAITSFAADLSPLLELTKHGLMFRDEPTETLIRQDYAADSVALRALSDNLLEMQGTSVYAATTLPGLLKKLGDGARLFALAFDERLPEAIKSPVGLQAIRYARLRAAIAHAAVDADLDKLLPLCVEMSTLAAVDQRGSGYIVDHPQLTVASGDVDSVRRLFELRTNWPGTRHARLAIAHALLGDQSDAFRHAQRVDEWTRHFYEQDDEYRRKAGGPNALDMAALPFCYLTQGDATAAAKSVARWKDWFAFEVSNALLMLVRTAQNVVQKETLGDFLSALAGPGALAAAIRFADGDLELQERLIRSLAGTCVMKPSAISLRTADHRSRERPIVHGLLNAAAVALALRMDADARSILLVIPVPPPSLYVFMDSHWTGEVYPYLAHQVLTSLCNQTAPCERDLLPQELTVLASVVPPGLVDQEFRSALKLEVERFSRSPQEGSKAFDYNTKSSADRFIDERLKDWQRIALGFAQAIRGRQGIPGSLTPLLDIWTELRSSDRYYSGNSDAKRQHNAAGERLLTLALGASCRLDTGEVQRYASMVISDGTITASRLTEIVNILARRPPFHALAGQVASRVRTAIEREDDVDQRASSFAALAQAIYPASAAEAVEYFRRGLEQMDAIGSGDYQFANELMQLASEMRGPQLGDSDSHTLSNICELNLGEEHKFNWAMYGAAMAKASGLKGLAKLARWEDRDRISIDYTLLPYLRALLESDQIDPEIALTLLRLSNPAELHVCGTEQFAETLGGKEGINAPLWTKTLIDQYARDNPGSFSSSASEALAGLARRFLGDTSPEYLYLDAAAIKRAETRADYNHLQNWREPSSDLNIPDRRIEDEAERALIETLAFEMNPMDEMKLAGAISSADVRGNGRRRARELLKLLRPKVAFSDWPAYVKMIARQDDLDLYDKLNELQACKGTWLESSQAVATALRECAAIVASKDALEFISWGHLSGSHLKDLSEISGVSRNALVLTLVGELARPDTSISGAVWLSLASEFNKDASPGVAQQALSRLLRSGPAKLASSVADGSWQPALYPSGDPVETAAGLIWFALGSPNAARRWMAAHGLVNASRLGRSDIIDKVVALWESKGAGAFQAGELRFFDLHAQLWLLIALARIALEDPACVARHEDLLVSILTNEQERHVLRRHFAANALRTCLQRGACKLDEAALKVLEDVNHSPYPIKTVKHHVGDSFYQPRPDKLPAPDTKFYLDYDFEKDEVDQLARVFSQSRWKTSDALVAWVRQHDSEITHMSDQGGRSGHGSSRNRGISDDHHSYGEHLCWHALLSVAGAFLEHCPVVRSPHDERDPWADWLKSYSLTHSSGLWLADGTDLRPVDTLINLREVNAKGVGLTGTPEKLLSLLGIQAAIGEWMIVDASWNTMDGVDVRIQSALIPAAKSARSAARLARTDPFRAFLPRFTTYGESGEETDRSEAPFAPWIVAREGDAMLDVADKLAAPMAARRGRLANAVNAKAEIISRDPFHRSWINPDDRILVRTEVWAPRPEGRDGSDSSGSRLHCNTSVIRDVLASSTSHLLLLLILRRYEAGYGSERSKFWHTTAVVRVTESLDYTLFPGRVNELHRSDF